MAGDARVMASPHGLIDEFTLHWPHEFWRLCGRLSPVQRALSSERPFLRRPSTPSRFPFAPALWLLFRALRCSLMLVTAPFDRRDAMAHRIIGPAHRVLKRVAGPCRLGPCRTP